MDKKYVAVEENLLNKMLAIMQELPYRVASGVMDDVKTEGNIVAIETLKAVRTLDKEN